MIQIDLSRGEPVYQQIVDQVRLGIASGRLRPGDRLEPVRDLARRLGVNTSTVAHAYQNLAQSGVIETNRRRGSVIACGSEQAAMSALRESRLRSIMEQALVEALALGYTPAETEAAFGLQLAAWRERRLGIPSASPLRQVDGHAVTFSGSHDLALEALWSQARRADPALLLSANYVGSLEGLLALWRGEADFAGAHLLDVESGDYNLPILRRLFAGQALCVITLAERQQGLIVPPGNPLDLQGWHDLARSEVRFVNRQPGSGTRTLLDHHLRQEGISPASIAGYDTTVSTHLAAAAAVADGHADVALGLLAAARAYGLAFIPLAHERYDLVLRAENRRPCESGEVREQHSSLNDILDMVGSQQFRVVVAELGGYDTAQSGREVYL